MSSQLKPRELLLKNIKVKIFSLACAIFIWVYVVMDNTYEYAIAVPIRPVNLPKEWIFLEPLQPDVEILFRGTGKFILSSIFHEKYIELDLEENPHIQQVILNAGMLKKIDLHKSFQMVRFVGSDTVSVHLDRFVEKYIPVESQIALESEDGYVQVGAVEFIPDSVRINGPQTLVEQVERAFTRDVEYAHLKQPVRRKVALIPPESELVSYDVKSVMFNADIQRIHEEEFREIPVSVINVPRGKNVQAVPSTISLKLQGGVDVLRELDRDEIHVAIDFRNRYRYGSRGIPATIHVPEGITFSDVKPQFFDLLIEK